MTQTASFALISFGLGVMLLLAEVLLPTHGILGLLAGLSIITGVGACFAINPAVGLVILVALIVATPLIWTAFVKYWPKTPVGRRLVLSEVAGRTPRRDPIEIGQTGVTVSELRPMGECEFGGLRIEAISEQGMIHPGTRVKVIALSNHRPVVQIT
jgi:membrane-bound ClpP family serine protease